MREGAEFAGSPNGRYLYCLAKGAAAEPFGPIGINGARVYTKAYGDFCAVVHDCPAQPYDTKEEQRVCRWIMAHHKVIEKAWEKFGDVLPCRFNTIFQGQGSEGPERALRLWMERERPILLERLDQIWGKVEYGAQISWNPRMVGETLMAAHGPIRELRERIASMPEGAAYLHREKLAALLKVELSRKADLCFKKFYRQIRARVTDVKVGKARDAEGENQMIINLSCLVPRVGTKALTRTLREIDREEGFSVKLTGPWPPYSFS